MADAKRVVVLGASPKPQRYAFKAVEMLTKHGHEAVPVNPAYDRISGLECFPDVSAVPGPVDTITVYLGKHRSGPLTENIIEKAPRRLILNPGAENDDLAEAASKRGIEVVEGCTLVMLTIGTF